MYRLTPRMFQKLQKDLQAYHELFDAKRCDSWQLEELIVRAIKFDTSVNPQVKWTEAGHDDKADITIRSNGTYQQLQIKSGKILPKKGQLELSGHRLGKYRGDMDKISDYLNSSTADILSVPYSRVENKRGRHHQYQIAYVPIQRLHGLRGCDWTKKQGPRGGVQYTQSNSCGVEFRILPSMSWQVWWRIPLELIDIEPEFSIS